MYRFLDNASVIPGVRACGKKLVSMQDWYVNIRDNINPTVPEGFLLESLMQTGVLTITTKEEICDKLMYFHSCESMQIFEQVRPGGLITTNVKLLSFRHGVAKFEGEASVNSEDCERTAMKAEYTLIAPSYLR